MITNSTGLGDPNYCQNERQNQAKEGSQIYSTCDSNNTLNGRLLGIAYQLLPGSSLCKCDKHDQYSIDVI